MRPLVHLHLLPSDFGSKALPLELVFGKHHTVLRWLRPHDVGRLLTFFGSHTPETIRSRYGYLFTRLSSDRAAHLVGVDQSVDAALGVFEANEPGHLVAIGRYCRAEDGTSAELAFVVREDRRGLGIATALLHALIAIARERGLLRLTAQVQCDNGTMLGVFRHAGATFTAIPGSGTFEATIALPT
jgi:GNAT superfamily N-acetyltransferase